MKIDLTTDQLPTDDGATVDLGGGYRLRLRITPDEWTTIEDDEYLGRVQWSYGGDWAKRPEGFDGNAEVIRADRGSRLWWQPSDYAPKRGTVEFYEYRRNVSDLLEYGFSVVTLELLRRCECCGVESVDDVNSLGGVDLTGWPVDNVVRNVVSDLVRGFEIPEAVSV